MLYLNILLSYGDWSASRFSPRFGSSLISASQRVIQTGLLLCYENSELVDQAAVATIVNVHGITVDSFVVVFLGLPSLRGDTSSRAVDVEKALLQKLRSSLALLHLCPAVVLAHLVSAGSEA